MRPIALLPAAASAALLLAVTGCGSSGASAPTGDATSDPPPSPSATAEAVASAEPTSTAAADPTAASGSAAPDASAPPSGGVAACSDALVLGQLRTSGWSWNDNTDAGQLRGAAPTAAFEPSAALDGLEVRCVVQYRHPTDGERGYADASIAIAAGGDESVAAIAGWALANGYEDHHGELVVRADDSTFERKLWMHVVPEGEAAGSDALAVAEGAQPGDVVVTAFDWSEPSG